MKPWHLILTGAIMFVLVLGVMANPDYEPGGFYEHPLIWTINVLWPLLLIGGIVWSIVRHFRHSKPTRQAGPYR